MTTRLPLMLVCIILAISLKAQSTFGYKNPILPGMNPDPSICKAGDDYYVVTSSFIQYPGLPIYHSKDLINWELINYCCKEENGLDVSKGSGLYAPTIRYDERSKTFYVICTNVRNGGNFITSTKDPAGTWSQMKYITHPEMQGIDPSLMFDDNGKCYFTATHVDGIIQAEINPETCTPLTTPRLIWGGTGGRYPEGPHLYHIGPWYYLIISEGGTEFGHHVVASRSNNPWGPFEECPYNPILSHIEKIAQYNPIQCTGHSDLVEGEENKWWAVFLATRPTNGSCYHLGRETFLSPINWTRDNWPIFNQNGVVYLDMNVETLPQQSKPSTDTTFYDFNGNTLPLNWNYYKNPIWKNYSVNSGQLTLKGTSDNERETFCGVRQEEFNMEITTAMQILSSQGEAGLSVRHSPRAYYNIAYIKKNNRSYIKSEFVFDQVNQHNEIELKNKVQKIYLKIKAEKSMYHLFYSIDNKEWKKMGKMDSKFLAGGFSGLLTGLYAKGKNTIASFDFMNLIKQ